MRIKRLNKTIDEIKAAKKRLGYGSYYKHPDEYMISIIPEGAARDMVLAEIDKYIKQNSHEIVKKALASSLKIYKKERKVWT